MGFKMLTEEQLKRVAEIRALRRQVPRGPWGWFGNIRLNEVFLGTPDRGRLYLMRFKRWGMGSAQPEFQVTEGDPELTDWKGRMVLAKDLVNPRNYDQDFIGIDHPMARFIVEAGTFTDELLDMIDQLLTENAELRGAASHTG